MNIIDRMKKFFANIIGNKQKALESPKNVEPQGSNFLEEIKIDSNDLGMSRSKFNSKNYRRFRNI